MIGARHFFSPVLVLPMFGPINGIPAEVRPEIFVREGKVPRILEVGCQGQ